MTASWGRLPIADVSRVLEADWRFDALPDLEVTDSLLARGCGRSYGDTCINSGASQLSTRRLNRFITFDAEHGVLHCEAGVTLNEILQVIVPRGWFLPVVPGTRYVTLGGAVAHDVHGKNHHYSGSFGCHVRSLTLLRSDGQRLVCDHVENGGLFAATIGGLGLTGLITSAEIGLIPIASDQLQFENIAFNSISEFSLLSEESENWEYNVSWVDTTARNGQVGRGIFSRARHVGKSGTLDPGRSKPILGVPVATPVSMVNKWTVDPFNRLYYLAKNRKRGLLQGHYQPFFFPLDAIANWNRVYGKGGFYQYQCVVPHDNSEEVLTTLLRVIADSDEASFLAVLKEFGDIRSPGLLSFPRPGVTLAVDFPNRGDKTLRLLDALDETVLAAGGALYPAKDARMPATLFESGYPEIEKFKAEMDSKFSSAFWRRVQP